MKRTITSSRTRQVLPLAISLLVMTALLVLAGCRLFDRGPDSNRGGGSRAGRTNPQPLCPIDGVPADDAHLQRRPLAVLVENSPQARPQSGLTEACVVYEAITEGGITRFLAIYHHANPEIIGPVRSARPHFIHLAREYDAVLVHCGQSYEALQIFATNPSIKHLDEMLYPKPFWRDRARKAPHNLYTSAEQVRAFMSQQGWESAPALLPNFTGSGSLPANSETAQDITVSFGGAMRYRLRLLYDAERGGYLRYMDGKLHTDRVTGEPIVAKNVVVQRVWAEQFAHSSLNTYDVTVTGSGVGTFMSGGRQLPLEWRKLSDASPTDYHDAYGRPLPFATGQTWVLVVPSGGTVTVNTPATE